MITSFEVRKLGAVKGSFFIPSYQRGYRWGENEVLRLLDDIYQNKDNNYCLQPIVVRKDGETYRVIDGQQRLTTLFIIRKFLHEASRGFIEAPAFCISYETRPNSQSFLESSPEEMIKSANENVDYFFMYDAYTTISAWFDDASKESSRSDLMSLMSRHLNENVSVIWYEIDEGEDERKLFTRLNIGKIPLTSAELIKAMFLSQAAPQSIKREKQEEIALQWDNIEKELHNESLWYFLTNDSGAIYQTRIDLILSLVAGRLAEENDYSIDRKINDPYFTFFVFDALDKSKLEKYWEDITFAFSLLKDWHENHTLYHKIGYLITAGCESLESIYKLSNGLTKKEFESELDTRIKNSISFHGSLEDLSYEHNYGLIQRILLLFNVESVRRNGEQTQWFPFDKYKAQNWSLEHIHAQKSETSRVKEVWQEWLRLHLESLNAIIDDNNKKQGDDALLEEIKKAIEETIDYATFENLRDRVIDRLSVDSNEEYVHAISNLALLNTSDNSALNNSAFDVKRSRIIEMDKTGQFIPFCTKMAFLKYYTESSKNQVHFWGEADRNGYLDAMKMVLGAYLAENEEEE